ncbi:MAG: hypothetical protein KJ923_03195 [Candidatus Omnitrophica bacterium]|nr:hypothetical protein [Candidatus Omnitrophota bacterium]MBU1905986.1 hypothetical protein [Candidatus Omnitrophota bacterium]
MNKAGFTFIGIILALAIVLFLGYIVLNSYLNMPGIDKETKKLISEQGIDTTTYKTVIDTTKETMQGVTRQRMQQLEAID